MGIARLPGLPFIGNLLQMRDTLGLLEKVRRMEARFVQTRLGPYTTYFLWDKETAAEILHNRQGLFIKGPTLRKFARPILGNGIIPARDEDAKRQREVVSRAFSSGFDDHYIKIFIENTQRMCQDWERKGAVLLEREMTKLSLDLLGKTLLATDFSQYEGKMMNATEAMYEYIIGCMKNPFITNINIPYGRFKKAKQSLNVFHQILEDILINMEDREKGAFLKDVSLLSPQDYKDMVLNIFFAGHETTSTCLFWTVSLLLQHPDAYAEVKSEVCGLAEDELTSFIKKSDSFLAQVILESMRLYPPVHTVGRELTVSSEVCGESFRKGDLFVVSLYLMGRNPDTYSNPSSFEPHRFDDASLQGEMMPYSIGPRACLGKHFADIELRAVMLTILRSVDLVGLGKIQQNLKFYVTLRPQSDITLTIN